MIKRILGFSSACIAFYIGSGFATMQEIMQYEASYGSMFWVVILTTAIIYIYTNLSFIENGHNAKIRRGGDIYKVYCGNHIGIIYDYFSAFFCYMCFVVMCGGANSTAIEQWGLPNGVGAIILSISSITTVYFGLNNVLKVLKYIGPIIIFLILLIAILSIINSSNDFISGIQSIDNKQYKIIQVGRGNPIASGISYGGFVILWFASFLGELGSKYNPEEVKKGMMLSSIAIFGTAALCCIALITNIDMTWNVEIPALTLANMIHPMLALFFAIIIYLGIYTSACPLLWTGIRKISKDGTTRYKLFTVIGGISGCLIACLFPYKGLLNILYGINGYLGFILIAFMIVNDIRVFLLKNR